VLSTVLVHVTILNSYSYLYIKMKKKPCSFCHLLYLVETNLFEFFYRLQCWRPIEFWLYQDNDLDVKLVVEVTIDYWVKHPSPNFESYHNLYHFVWAFLHLLHWNLFVSEKNILNSITRIIEFTTYNKVSIKLFSYPKTKKKRNKINTLFHFSRKEIEQYITALSTFSLIRLFSQY
jgi:hypothetical protein